MKKRITLLFLCAALFTGAAAPVAVINAGHSGWNSAQLLKTCAKELEEAKPDLVILLIGTNDNLNSRNLIPPEVFQENLQKMVKMIRQSGAEVLLCEIPDANQELMTGRHKKGFFKYKSAEEKVARANEIIAGVAAAEKVPLLKTTEVLGKSTLEKDSLFFNPANSGNADGVHPTPEGYAKLAQAIAERIKKEGLSPKRILCLGDSITAGARVKGRGTAGEGAETYPARLAALMNER